MFTGRSGSGSNSLALPRSTPQHFILRFVKIAVIVNSAFLTVILCDIVVLQCFVRVAYAGVFRQ